MICKFCNASLEEGVTLCPECGKENAEELETVAAEEVAVEEIPAEEAVAEETPVEASEAPAKKSALWVKILAAVGALALAAVLIGAVIYGIRAADKSADSYTVSDEQAVKAMDTVVATVGDLELTNNTLQVYYRQAIEEFYNAYGYYLDASVLDLEKPLDEQFYDEENGVTWQQFFLDSALSSWSRYAALYMQGKEDGFVLSQEVQTYLDGISAELDAMAAQGGYESTEVMLKEDISAGCDMDGYMGYISTNIYAGQYLESIYETLIPSTEEVETYYRDNEAALNEQGIVNDGSATVDVRHILICPQGGTEDENGGMTYSEEEWEQCRIKAQEILDKWSSESGTEEGFAQFAAEYTEDPGSMATGGLYTDVYVGQMVEPFENWCFDETRKPGDTGLVQTNYGYHIMYFVEAREIWVTNVTDTIIYERSLSLVNDAAAKWPLETKYKKIVLSELQLTTAE